MQGARVVGCTYVANFQASTPPGINPQDSLEVPGLADRATGMMYGGVAGDLLCAFPKKSTFSTKPSKCKLEFPAIQDYLHKGGVAELSFDKLAFPEFVTGASR